MKFITLDNLNENLKSFYKNIIKPEIIKNSSENSTTVIQDNKIVGGKKKQKFSYEGFAEKLIAATNPKAMLAKDLARGDDEGHTYIQTVVSEDGQTLEMNYIMVAPKSAVISGLENSEIAKKMKRIMWHREYYDETEQIQGIPYGTFINCQENALPTKENFAYLKSKIDSDIGVNIVAAVDIYHNKYYNPDLEEVSVNDDDYIMGIMKGYYYCTTNEVSVNINEMGVQGYTDFAFYFSDRARKDITIHVDGNYISETLNITTPITGDSTAEDAAQALQAELSKALYFREFTSVDQINLEYNSNTSDKYYAVINGKLHLLSESGWIELGYFSGQTPFEVNLVSPLPETITIPATPVIDIEEPTIVDGKFYIGNNFDSYGKYGENFIMNFLVKNPDETSQITFSMEQCGVQKFTNSVKKIVRSIVVGINWGSYPINNSNDFDEALKATDFSGLRDGNQVIVYKVGTTDKICIISRIN